MSTVRGSHVVTALGWGLMLGGVLLMPISLITALMLLAGSYGTAGATFGGVLLFVFGPACAALAGFGLWRRWRWALACVLVMLLTVILLQVLGWWRGPTPEHSYLSPGGTRTTVSASEAQYSLPLALACAALLAFLLQPRIRAEFAVRQPGPRGEAATTTPHQGATPASAPEQMARGWRVGHRGRDAPCITRSGAKGPGSV